MSKTHPHLSRSVSTRGIFSPMCAALALSLGLLASSAIADAKVRKGDRAAKLSSVTDLAGKKVDVKKMGTDVVVLTFGASWCKPCSKELPVLEKLAKEYKGKGVTFAAINIDSDKKKGEAFMKKAGLSLVKQLFDPKSGTVATYDPPTMPSTFLIKKGVVRHVHAGYRKGDDTKLKKLIDSVLK